MDDFSDIGEKLRNGRKAKGLSLQDIQKATKIRMKYLEALENWDVDELPPGVYSRGIIRRYCEQVDIDSEPLLKKYDEWMQEKERQKSLTQRLSRSPGSGDITLRSAQSDSAWKGISAVLIILLVIAAGAGVYYLATGPFSVSVSLPGFEPQETEEPLQDQQPEVEPDEGETADEPEDDTDTDDPGGQQDSDEVEGEEETERQVDVIYEKGPGNREVTYEISGAENISVEIQTEQRCWVRVTADGQQLVEETLEVGVHRYWEAEEELIIRAGNPAGIILIVNGVSTEIPDPVDWRDLIFSLQD